MLVHAMFKIVPTSKQFSHPLNSTAFTYRQYTKYHRQEDVGIRGGGEGGGFGFQNILVQAAVTELCLTYTLL